MYSYITGKVIASDEGHIILENNGIGYSIFVPNNELYYNIGGSEDIRIWTYLSVSQDALSLYGFLSKEECDIFKMLITVSGIGPKGALGILGNMSVNELILAIMQEDAKLIAQSPGIGKKTAGKLILELKDKIKNEDIAMFDNGSDINMANIREDDPRSEAVEALVALGYSRSEAVSATKNALPDMTVEEILKEALKKL